MNAQEIQKTLDQTPETFETHIQGHKQQVTKCNLTGVIVTVKHFNKQGVVLGKIRNDGRKQYAYIIKMINGAKFTASRRDFTI